MPIPIFLIVSGVIAAVGAFNGLNGQIKENDADGITDYETGQNEKAFKNYQEAIEECNELLSAFGNLKIKCNEMTTAAAELLKPFTKIELVTDNIYKLSVNDKGAIADQIALTPYTDSDGRLMDVINAIGSGAAAGKGALLLTGTFAKASTGVAISSLKGAAATKATYAAIGGGAIKAGGMGIIGGKLILGGMIAAPIILIAGFCKNRAGEEMLTEAAEYRAKSEIYRQVIDSEIDLIAAIHTRATELGNLISDLGERLSPLCQELADLSEKARIGRNLTLTGKEKSLVSIAVMLIKTLKDLMTVPVYDESGKLSVKAETCLTRGQQVLKTISER